MKNIRIDIRLSNDENNLLNHLMKEGNCNRTDLIIKMINFCIIEKERFLRYGK